MKKLPTWVEVDLDHLAHNLKSIRKKLGGGTRILLTVKADAYGHGAVQVAEASSKFIDIFGVATLDEAMELKEAGITNTILILSPILKTEIPAVTREGLTVTISSYEIANELSSYAVEQGRIIPIHVEVDTGMGRAGVVHEEAIEEITKISALHGVELDGVYTHFPVSDSDVEFTRWQIKELTALVAVLREKDIEIPMIHSANSAAVAAIEDSHLDLVRPGLLAYGYLPAGVDVGEEFVPILTWKSRLARIRNMPVGKTVSYGRTFTTERETVVGVVPVGYGHGYPYALSGKGRMLVAGQKVPIIGRVTMDMTMIDLTDLAVRPETGDEVVLVGQQDGPHGRAAISIHDLADWAGTIGYEILCGLSKRIPRTYFRKGRVETYKSLLGILPNHVSV